MYPPPPSTAITGLRFFFATTLDRGDALADEHPASRVSYPLSSSVGEVTRLLHRDQPQASPAVAYGAGLRVSEVVHLVGSTAIAHRSFASSKASLCHALAELQGTTQLVGYAHSKGKMLPAGWVPGTKLANPSRPADSMKACHAATQAAGLDTACFHAQLASRLRYPPAGSSKEHSRHPGTVGAQKASRPPHAMRMWRPRSYTK